MGCRCAEAGINPLNPRSLVRPGSTRDPRLVASGQSDFSHYLWGWSKSNVLSVIRCKKEWEDFAGQRDQRSLLVCGFWAPLLLPCGGVMSGSWVSQREGRGDRYTDYGAARVGGWGRILEVE